ARGARDAAKVVRGTECAADRARDVEALHRRVFAEMSASPTPKFALLAALCAALAAPAAAETVRVGKAGRDAFSVVPADVGAQTGIFKKHGIDVEISSFGGDARVQQAMTADGIDVGLGSGPGLAFVVKGSPVKGIAAMADPPLTFALVVRNDTD